MPDQPNTSDGGRRVRFVRAWPAPDESNPAPDEVPAEGPGPGQGPEANPDPDQPGSTAFPGGRVRLPRIEEARRRRAAQDAATESSVRFVGTAFVRPRRQPDVEEPTQNQSGFSEYYTYESLFDAPHVEESPPANADDQALAELGLDRKAAWSDVVAAHRQLVKETHPDLLVGADAAVIEAATDRLRSINLAYARLKASRRAHRASSNST